MQNNGVRSFSLLTVMRVYRDFTGACLVAGLRSKQRIALERRNQRIVRYDVQPRLLGFTMFSEEEDLYVYELSETAQELRLKLTQGEEEFSGLVKFIGFWEAFIEDEQPYVGFICPTDFGNFLPF